MNEIASVAEKLQTEIAKAIVGQEEAITSLVIALLTGGHVLLEGVPGVAKTLMTRCLATATGGEFKRIQFTPDLMPSDVIGTTVYNAQAQSFAVRRGPVFAHFVLADEVNRAPAKTQSALLQAMEERLVTIEGQDLPLPDPFVVCATQNPIEYEGTYPLPEAQLDRFMFKIRVNYPEEAEEIEILRRVNEGRLARRLEDLGLVQVTSPDEVAAVRGRVDGIRATEEIVAYVARLVRATRTFQGCVLGASPRAAIALLRGAKGKAALDGRDFVIPEDVQTVAPPTLRHRLILSPEQEIEGRTADEVIKDLLKRVAVPR